MTETQKELYVKTVKRLARGGVKNPTAQIIALAEEIDHYREKIHGLEKQLDEEHRRYLSAAGVLAALQKNSTPDRIRSGLGLPHLNKEEGQDAAIEALRLEVLNHDRIRKSRVQGLPGEADQEAGAQPGLRQRPQEQRERAGGAHAQAEDPPEPAESAGAAKGGAEMNETRDTKCPLCGAPAQVHITDELTHISYEYDEPAPQVPTLQGYPLHELMMVAALLRQRGVTLDDLQDLKGNFQRALDLVRAEQEILQKAALDQMLQNLDAGLRGKEPKNPTPQKCKCWRPTDRYYPYASGECTGTRECDPCRCGGDRAACDYYPHIREEAQNHAEI